MVFRGLVRAVQRQWIGGSLCALLLFVAGLALLPFVAPARATGRLLLKEDGLSPAQAEAMILGDTVLQEAARLLTPTPDPFTKELEKLRGSLSISTHPRELALTASASTPQQIAMLFRAFDTVKAAQRSDDLKTALRLKDEALRNLKSEREELLRKASSDAAPLLPQRLHSMERDLSQEEAELAVLSGRLDRLAQRIEKNESSGIAQPVDTRESDRIEAELAQTTRERAELKSRTPEDKERLAQVNARVEDLTARHALRLNRETLSARFAPVREMIDETRRLFAAQQRLLDSVHWRRGELERLRAESRHVPVSLAPDRDLLGAQIAMLEDSLRSLEKERLDLATRLASPALPDRRILPTRTERASWGWPALLMVCLITGLVAALTRESLCGTLRTQHDVVRYVNLPLLGQLPRTAESSLLRGAPESLVEAFRSSALLVESKARTETLKLLAITSPRAGDGKSTAAAGLAVTLARNGLRILLVDADLRRPTQHQLFGAPNETGLSTYLSGGVDSLDPVLVATEVENLVLLPAGPVLENLPGWFRSERFQSLCRDLRGWYDLTLIDLPPANEAAESLAVASQSDGVLLLVAAGRTGKDDVTEAKRLLRASGGKLWGCILNQSTLRSHGYEYYTAVSASGGEAGTGGGA